MPPSFAKNIAKNYFSPFAPSPAPNPASIWRPAKPGSRQAHPGQPETGSLETPAETPTEAVENEKL
jgi:hypothetical protein